MLDQLANISHLPSLYLRVKLLLKISRNKKSKNPVTLAPSIISYRPSTCREKLSTLGERWKRSRQKNWAYPRKKGIRCNPLDTGSANASSGSRNSRMTKTRRVCHTPSISATFLNYSHHLFLNRFIPMHCSAK